MSLKQQKVREDTLANKGDNPAKRTQTQRHNSNLSGCVKLTSQSDTIRKPETLIEDGKTSHEPEFQKVKEGIN